MSRLTSQPADTLARYLAYVLAAVIAMLPFHALFTTWLGSNFGHLDLFRIWKEIIIVACLVPAGYLMAKSAAYQQWLRRNWLPRLIIAYIGLTVVLGLVAFMRHQVNGPALIYGLLANLRYLGFFMLVVLVASQQEFLRHQWPKIVLFPAAVVLGVGLLQRFALPYDFLRHFGYGPKTIPAYETVDNKINYRRIQSTLRGANPLGAYLLVIVSILVARLCKSTRWLWAIFLAALVVLFLSYSRSAYLGAALASAVVVFYSLKSELWRKRLLVLAVVGVIIIGAGIALLRHNQIVENTVFHTDNTSRSTTSSNSDRASALKAGWHDVVHEPLGRGSGTAGPESTRNNHPARIAENYFLQIGQEVGWLGLALLIAINILVGHELWQRRSDPLALALFASLIGLSLVNLLSHAWADDTLGLLWWGLAGVALTPGILNSKRKRNETSQKTG